jgi:hypothetical protein
VDSITWRRVHKLMWSVIPLSCVPLDLLLLGSANSFPQNKGDSFARQCQLFNIRDNTCEWENLIFLFGVGSEDKA